MTIPFQEREIVCCGPSGWTKAIAWIEIILNLASISILTTYIYVVASSVGMSGDNIELDFMAGRNGELYSLTRNQFYMVMFGGLFMSLVGLLMGVILLQGAKQRNVRYLRAWTFFTATVLVLSMISLVLRDGPVNEILFRMIVTATLYGFCIMIVQMHIADIRRSEDKPPEYSKAMLQTI